MISFVCITDHYPGFWSRGETQVEALKEFRRSKNAAWGDAKQEFPYIMVSVESRDGKVWVDQMANLHWELPEGKTNEECQPVEVKRGQVKL